MLSILNRVPFIVTILAGQFGHRTAQYSSIHRYLLGLALRRAARIFVSNTDQERALRRLPLLSSGPIDTIGCSMPLIQSLEYDPALTAFLKGGTPAIVAVGAMRKVYGFHVLVEACSLLHDQGLSPRLLIAVSGKDDEEMAAAVEESVREANGSVDVRVERELPHGVCLGCIDSADILARPTSTDGDSVSVHEALLLGTTVVASDAAPRPEGVIVHESGNAHAVAASLAKAYRSRPQSWERRAERPTSVEDIIRCYGTVLST
jgi:glycosyltransferase involved in cell wall biosynthesis